MKSKLGFVVILFVVSEALPQPPPPPPAPPSDAGQRPPFGLFAPPLNILRRNLERLRPLPDRPLNIDVPFPNGKHPKEDSPSDNQQNSQKFYPMVFNQRRIHPRPPPRPIAPIYDDNSHSKSQQPVRANNEDSKKESTSHDNVTTKVTPDVSIIRPNKGLSKIIPTLKRNQSVRNRAEEDKNTENKENLFGKPKISKIDGPTVVTPSQRNTVVAPSTTLKISEIAKENRKTYTAGNESDSLNNVDSDLLNQIFGSEEDESSTTETTTEFYETTTWDDPFNRIGAPPAVVASLLG